MNFFAGITMLVLLPWKKVQIFAVLTATRTKYISICNNLLHIERFCAKIIKAKCKERGWIAKVTSSLHD